MLNIDLTFLVIFFLIWVLVLILSRVFWKPMVRTIEERSARIRDDQAAALASLTAYEQSLQDIDRTVKAAKKDAERVRAELEVEALKEKSRFLAEVGAAAKGEVERARAKLREDVSRLKTELKSEAERLSERIEERLLKG
jgi:F-type H+-transporting ATPase subunit b